MTLKTALLAFSLACAPALLNAEGGAHLHNNTSSTWYLVPIPAETWNRKPITSMAVRRVCGELRSDLIVTFGKQAQPLIEVSPGIQVFFVPLTFGDSGGILPHFDGAFHALSPRKCEAAFRLWTYTVAPQKDSHKSFSVLDKTVQVTLQVQAPDPEKGGAMGISPADGGEDPLGDPLLEGAEPTTLDIDLSEMNLDPFTLRQEKGSGPWLLRPAKASGCCVVL